MEFLLPGFVVRIVAYDGERQVTTIAEVVSYDQGLLTVEDKDKRTTVYNLRSPGVVSVSEMFPEDEDLKRFRPSPGRS